MRPPTLEYFWGMRAFGPSPERRGWALALSWRRIRFTLILSAGPGDHAAADGGGKAARYRTRGPRRGGGVWVQFVSGETAVGVGNVHQSPISQAHALVWAISNTLVALSCRRSRTLREAVIDSQGEPAPDITCRARNRTIQRCSLPTGDNRQTTDSLDRLVGEWGLHAHQRRSIGPLAPSLRTT